MTITWPDPDKYIVAVSGGVDSMALLHMLYVGTRQEDAWQLTVAHLDHGIRSDSSHDVAFVKSVAEEYDIPFVTETVALGEEASEETARRARYDFLKRVQQQTGAEAIIMAHHQDDVIETCIINMLRGTGRKGLTSLVSTKTVLRPLLKIPKPNIIQYAEQHELQWREDSTNQNQSYLRNYIRHTVLSRLDGKLRTKLLKIIEAQLDYNTAIDSIIETSLAAQPPGMLDRAWFNNLPHTVAREIMASWLREHGVRNFSRRNLDKWTTVAKVTYAGKQIDIMSSTKMQVGTTNLALIERER